MNTKELEAREAPRFRGVGLTCVGPEVDGELAGVAAGVRAELAFVRPLVGMYPQVLLEAAAVHGSIVTQVTLVGLHAGVTPHVHGQVVLPAEALVTELTLVWFVSFKHIRKSQGFKGFLYQDDCKEM